MNSKPLVSGAQVNGWTEETLRAAVEHGLQREAFARVRARLSTLGTLEAPNEWYDFQRELCADVIWAQEYKARCARNLKRQRAGRRQIEEPESGSWATEHRIASRVEKQLRSVGDAFAWKLLDCERQVFWVLAQNANPGLMYGKVGLKAELNQVDSHWSRGRFALLNDLTLSIRIGDLTVFDGDRRYLDEVKSNPIRSRREQRQRIERALATLNRVRPLDLAGKPHEMFRSSTQLKTRLKDLALALDEANESGLGARVIQPGWLVTAVSLVSGTRPEGDDPKGWVTWLDSWKSKAGLTSGQHVLRSIWSWLAWDLSDPLVAGVPFGAYPLEPARCAELICGYSMFQTAIRQDVVDHALRVVGFETEWLLRPQTEVLAEGEPVLRVSRKFKDGSRSITVPTSGMNQILYELVEPRRYASALAELMKWSLANLARGEFQGERSVEIGKATLSFANEKAIWFKR